MKRKTERRKEKKILSAGCKEGRTGNGQTRIKGEKTQKR